MKKMIVLFFIAATGFAFVNCANFFFPNDPVYIPASKQRSGDPEKGYQYLITGDYLKSGIPYFLFLMGSPRDTNNYLERRGNNKVIPYDFTAVKAPNGEVVVAPNCLQCHAQVFEGKLVVGLGNSLADFTVNRQSTALFAERFLKNLKGAQAKQCEAARAFINSIKTVAPGLIVPVKGVNTADHLAYLLVSYRNPQTLEWNDTAQLQLPPQLIPTDVPAWWLLKKKHAMFYNGFGRGDFGRFLMASNLLTVSDSSEAREVDSHFNDVLSYINSIEAPAYPKPVDLKIADQGRVIFNNLCSSCHGTYGSKETYPNLLIPAATIGTDSLLYTANYSNPQFINWFNKSWFTTGDHPAQLVPFKGYIAPPLDGIWATAPYLHNGAVPDLESLLNSKIRPKYWQRSFSNPQYNYNIPGWKYERKTAADNKETYNTTLPGYGNYGHTFGDRLSDHERKAVIEYLKTL